MSKPQQAKGMTRKQKIRKEALELAIKSVKQVPDFFTQPMPQGTKIRTMERLFGIADEYSRYIETGSFSKIRKSDDN